MDKLLASRDLAEVCLTYLNFDAFGDGPCPNKEAFNQRLEKYQFNDYAVRYWGFYVRGKGEEDSDILKALFNLFKSSQKCNAIRQHALLIEMPWLDFTKSFTWTPLHMIAREGLSTVYK